MPNPAFLALGIATSAHLCIGLRRRKGGNIYVVFIVFVCFTNFNEQNSRIFLKTENKNNILTVKMFSNLQQSPHFLLRGKVGQPSKRKRALCWSIYIISLQLIAVSHGEAGVPPFALFDPAHHCRLTLHRVPRPPVLQPAGMLPPGNCFVGLTYTA